VLAIGNSGPVRDLDTFVPAGARPLRVLHQRGAAGIDGLVSAAAGAAVADGGPVALILGDVSLLHDLGGLAAARTVTSPLAIVVVHNDGGRIFEQLPLGRLAALAPEVERLFVTPHGLQFGAAAALFGLRHFRVETRADLHVAVQHALGQPGATLVEVIVPPRAALAIRHQAWEAA
jgi:2-succinyl-5-enolpyruvyl-6-hydroxy-3-cyclohexene-1-carboxylate synthase